MKRKLKRKLHMRSIVNFCLVGTVIVSPQTSGSSCCRMVANRTSRSALIPFFQLSMKATVVVNQEFKYGMGLMCANSFNICMISQIWPRALCAVA